MNKRKESELVKLTKETEAALLWRQMNSLVGKGHFAMANEGITGSALQITNFQRLNSTFAFDK